MAEGTPTTVAYKQVGDLTLYIDVYPPATTSEGAVPAVVFFHGGGMTVGDRKSWFPTWLHKRTTAAGFAFISADYQLLPPGTGKEVLEDVVDLFAFLERTPSHGTVQVDATRLVTAGASAGGMCSFLAAVHASPKPCAVLSLYGLGGDLFLPHFLSPKTKPFFLGYEILDPANFSEYLYPASADLPPLAQSQPAVFGPDHPTSPGMPSNPRMPLARLWMQLGTYLDYWTGQHAPSLSDALRPLLPAPDVAPADVDEVLARTVPEPARALFPQLLVAHEWPRVLLVHGSEDTAVPAQSSRALHARLSAEGVQSALRIVDGSEHSFDLKGGAEDAFGALFDEAAEFLRGSVFDT
ncbi:alpha/beta-hydrolase [Gloeopeniophorella convolvens]|nr:alpha/beta-hydrolase [Gloeopeniophorella convolvens]